MAEARTGWGQALAKQGRKVAIQAAGRGSDSAEHARNAMASGGGEEPAGERHVANHKIGNRGLSL